MDSEVIQLTEINRVDADDVVRNSHTEAMPSVGTGTDFDNIDQWSPGVDVEIVGVEFMAQLVAYNVLDSTGETPEFWGLAPQLSLQNSWTDPGDPGVYWGDEVLVEAAQVVENGTNFGYSFGTGAFVHRVMFDPREDSPDADAEISAGTSVSLHARVVNDSTNIDTTVLRSLLQVYYNEV